MKYFFLFLFSTLFTGIQAQMVPDFDVTDSDGDRIQLYNDYLNQGKSVMLKIFFTSCPPCNAVAPDIQELYEDWGEGNNDVQFIELSDKSFDTDARVNAYKGTHDLTFPGVGAEGGSLDAVDPYSRAPIGPYFGTPTFVVIAPDGTYEFDVTQGGGLTLVEALDAAITRTGAVKPGGGPVRPDYAFEGELRSYQNNIISDQMIRLEVIPIEGAPDSLTERTFTLQSNQDGILQLPIDSLEAYEWYSGIVKAEGNYQITDNITDGLSTLDLIAIQRHILTVKLLPENYQLIASDVDFNEQINVLDLLKIQNAILGLPDAWSQDEDTQIVQPCGSGPFSLSDRIEGICTDPIIFTKLGDVNGDAQGG